MATPPLSPQAEFLRQRLFSRESELALSPLPPSSPPPPPPPIYVPIPCVFPGGVPFSLYNFIAYDSLVKKIISEQTRIPPFCSTEVSEIEDNNGVMCLHRPDLRTNPFPGIFSFQQYTMAGLSLQHGVLQAVLRTSLEMRQLPGDCDAGEVYDFPGSPRDL